MRINHNTAAMNTYSRLSSAQGAQAKSLEKLSSGLRINRAGDDAAGLAISEKMRGQISGLNQASRNAQDGISLIQTAEGGLNETHSILQRMRELAVQSANDTNTNEDRKNIQDEVDQLATEITRISDDTQFNGQHVLKDNFSATFHIGANMGQNISVDLNDMSAASLNVAGAPGGVSLKDGSGAEVAITEAAPELVNLNFQAGNYTVVDITGSGYEDGYSLGVKDSKGEIVGLIADEAADGNIVSASNTAENLGTYLAGELADGYTFTVEKSGLNVMDQASADSAIDTIDLAIKQVSSERSKLGATQNRLDHTINNLTTTSENLSAAESRIRDVDMAKEMMEFTKNNILNQASTAMLAQANQMPQGVLQLLG